MYIMPITVSTTSRHRHDAVTRSRSLSSGAERVARDRTVSTPAISSAPGSSGGRKQPWNDSSPVGPWPGLARTPILATTSPDWTPAGQLCPTVPDPKASVLDGAVGRCEERSATGG